MAYSLARGSAEACTGRGVVVRMGMLIRVQGLPQLLRALILICNKSWIGRSRGQADAGPAVGAVKPCAWKC
jgi:hypothetical protein